MKEVSSENIAIQCPFAGGNAVYRARVVYESINPKIQYDDDASCLALGIYRMSDSYATSENNISTLLLLPNPAKDEVIINYFVPLKYNSFSLVIYDLSGKEITQEKLNAEVTSYRMNISNLSSGFYLVKLFYDRELLASSKLMIIK